MIFPLTITGAIHRVFRGGTSRRISIWFAEWKANKIGRVTLNGRITELATPTAGSAPHGITPGQDGNLWFVEFGASRIGKVSTAGSFTEYVVPTNDGKPAFIAEGADGNLWFTEYNADKIGMITTAGAITEFSLPGVGGAEPPSPLVPFCTFGHPSARVIPPGWPTCSGPSCPIGIAAGPDNNLWFTEFRGNKIGRITTSD